METSINLLRILGNSYIANMIKHFLTARPLAEAVLNLPVVVFFSLVLVSRGPNFHSAKLQITQPGMITTRTMLWILK